MPMTNVLLVSCRFINPQPDYSAFREASYGHSTLEIKNRTHAFYHWNRNDDGKKVATDTFVLHNQYWLVQNLMLHCSMRCDRVNEYYSSTKYQKLKLLFLNISLLEIVVGDSYTLPLERLYEKLSISC